MRRSLILLLILLCCLTPLLSATSKKAAKLEDNLKQWEQFRWQGIIQVESSAFSMRKNFVLAKNTEAMRIDVLDSGVFGLQAKPLISIYIKDKIVLEAPTVKQLSGIDPNWFLPPGALDGLFNFTDSLLARSAEIVSKRQTEMASSLFSFDKDLRLSKITNNDIGLEFNITYNRRNQPTKIFIRRRDTKLAELQINEQKYGSITIEPLAESTPAPDIAELEKELAPDELLLEDIDLEALLERLKVLGLLDESELSEEEIRKLFDELKLDYATLKSILEYLKLGDLEFLLE